MGFLKKLFGKSEDEVIIEEEPEIIEPLESSLLCSQCEMPIHPGQRIKTFAGKKMHMKPCWYKLRSNAKANLFQ